MKTCTLYVDVISQNILSAQDRITLSQTEILYQELHGIESEPKKDEAVFLYRIVPGISYLSSFGIRCAGIAGLPTSLVERGTVKPNIRFCNNISYSPAIVGKIRKRGRD